MSGLDDPTRELCAALAEAVCWHDGERPRAYGARLAELRGMLRHAASTGDLGPLWTWFADDATAAHAPAVGGLGRPRPDRPGRHARPDGRPGRRRGREGR